MDDYTDSPSPSSVTQSLRVKFSFSLPTSEMVKRDVNRLWPRELRDQLALGFVMSVVPIVALFEVFIVTPFYGHSNSWWLQLAWILFLAFNFYGNLLKLILVDPSNGKQNLPSVLQPGYRFCSACQVNAPPRAYHCPVCNTCIWKRDHHCPFVGTCVGYFNHRYYLVAAAYAAIASAYVTWYHFDYVSYKIGGFSLYSSWWFMVPHVAFILRFISIGQFVTIAFFMGTAFCGGVAAYLCGCQLFCIFRGQSRPEYLLGIHSYDLGPLENLHQVLGVRWFGALINPFWPSPMFSDGMTFPTKIQEQIAERMKNM